MPLFECSKCRVVENTAASNFWVDSLMHGKPALCSECDPQIGKWHDLFPRQQAAEYVAQYGADAIKYPARVSTEKGGEG